MEDVEDAIDEEEEGGLTGVLLLRGKKLELKNSEGMKTQTETVRESFTCC